MKKEMKIKEKKNELWVFEVMCWMFRPWSHLPHLTFHYADKLIHIAELLHRIKKESERKRQSCPHALPHLRHVCTQTNTDALTH